MYQFFVWRLMNPFPLLVVATAAGLAILWWRRRETRRRLFLVSVPFAVLVLLSVPVVSYYAEGSLEWQYPPLEERPADADAIVVLSSTIYPADGPRKRPELNADTLHRCIRAADVYQGGPPLPVVVSGGRVNPNEPGPSCAAVMAAFLRRLGVRSADIILEPHSYTTFENAVESRKLLADRGLHKVVLVTDAIHLPRAIGCFRRQGLEVVPCGCQYRATPLADDRYHVVPGLPALLTCQRIAHEWVGIAWYRLRGRM